LGRENRGRREEGQRSTEETDRAFKNLNGIRKEKNKKEKEEKRALSHARSNRERKVERRIQAKDRRSN